MSEIYACICMFLIYFFKIFVFVRMLEEVKVIPKNWKITNKVVHTPTTPTETFFCGDVAMINSFISMFRKWNISSIDEGLIVDRGSMYEGNTEYFMNFRKFFTVVMMPVLNAIDESPFVHKDTSFSNPPIGLY